MVVFNDTAKAYWNYLVGRQIGVDITDEDTLRSVMEMENVNGDFPLNAIDSAIFAQSASNAATNAAQNAQNAASNAATASASTQRLMRKLHTEVSDASFMVIGDSTGNDSNEWVYLLTQSIAADFPKWNVNYLLWNDSTTSYNAPVVIQTGTGGLGRTLTVYNVSVAGFHTLHFQGARAAAAIQPYEPDLILISHGHNEPASPDALLFSRYVSLTESITEYLRGDVILIAQNPESANGNQAVRAEVYRQLATSRGFGFIDVHQAFVDTGNIPAYLIADGVHPNPAGSALWRDTVKQAFAYRPDQTPRAQHPSTLVVAGEQLLVNGDFSTLPAAGQSVGQPGAWWLDASTTVAKDTTNYESARGYGVKLTASSAVLSRIGQHIEPRRARGRWVTAAWRVFIPTGQPQTTGWVYISDGVTTTSIPGTYSPGAFQWIVASIKVDPAATALQTYMQLDGSNLSGATVTVDRVILSYGRFPRTSSDNSDRATVTGLAAKVSGYIGSGSPEGVITAPVGAIYTRTDAASRVNECIRPVSDLNTATTGWAANGGTLTAPTGYLTNTATAGTFDIHSATTTTFAVTGGASYVFMAEARASFALSVQFYLQFYTAGGVATGGPVAGSVVALTSAFAAVPSKVTTAPADAAFVNIRFLTSVGTPSAGQTFDVRHVLYEKATAAGTYFDGDTASGGGLTYAWTGTANASTSTAVSTLPPAYVKTGLNATTGWLALARG